VKIDVSLQEVAERAGPLTGYPWKFRYPGEPEEPSVVEPREALILARPPDEVRP
jgi:hypothetical protein